MKKLLVATTLAALTITTPTTVSAKPNNVRYSTGIVTGAKSITTTDGNVWHTKRKLHLCKGANVQVKFDTKGTKRKREVISLKEIATRYLFQRNLVADLSKIHTMIMDMFFMGQKMKQIYMGFWHIGMVVRVWIIRMNVGIIQKQWKKS